MKLLVVKDNTYVDSSKEVNDKDPKFKVGDLMMIVGQASPVPLDLFLIRKQFFHIRFKNLSRGSAGSNSLNLPCVGASKLESHWLGAL